MALLVTNNSEASEIADAYGLGVTIRYFVSDDEMGALMWLGHRYEIGEALMNHIEETDSGEYLLTLDTDAQYDIASALAREGFDRVPCLSDDTTLQRIVWAIGPMDDE